MPAFMVGPLVRRAFVDHTLYSQDSVLRTVEVLFGLEPLNIYDAASTPLLDAFASQAQVSVYDAIPSNIPMTKNPGKRVGSTFMLDGPRSIAIPDEEWAAMFGGRSLLRHLAYLRSLGQSQTLAADPDDK